MSRLICKITHNTRASTGLTAYATVQIWGQFNWRLSLNSNVFFRLVKNQCLAAQVEQMGSPETDLCRKFQFGVKTVKR